MTRRRDLRDRRDRQRPVDEGMTLVELLVAIGLTSLLMIVVCGATVVALRASDAAEARNDNLSVAQVGMAAATKVIRTAVLPDQLDDRVCTGCADSAIVQATGSQLSFYANLDNAGNGPSLVTLQALADPDRSGTWMLRQTLVPPTVLSDGSYTFCDVTSATCRFRTRVLCRGLPRNASVFRYYDFDGRVIASTTLTTTDLIRVSTIDVSLTVQMRPGQTRTPAESILQRVNLPNADVNVLTDDD
ncbi:PulJ/GspJ family protein [Nocardioides mangrovi]|uniref:Prepilin-type N-terminal cleavage/methylation domain-containing protein n=1 Tax=Nocardioides mangrovi TaxID=2874580 RepID=A0ABS7UIE3_9ACTN|nr:prepilin-type N-terminal cleavage/methylation domain-containing protein [Nocardioides mangrovi]MBZ5740021.1 prepilin-type N-terminal cleavage/methylation domain-containing protein [Nocardioides mangrovi]MBZ5740808.1 prepilin-type N-terminal cleavage/methylation domain-containing protein [Nocardioides mangrovi]